jgi:antirestriction protein ArdC
MAASQSRSRKTYEGPTAEEKIVASLIELMEAGSAPWRRPWDGTGGGHHVNLLSGHRYRGANPILLTLGMHIRASSLPFWCGFAKARKHGIFPRKGSKALYILRPQLLSREEQGVGGEVTLRSWASYRPVAVFNAADLEGEALPALIEARQESEGVERKPKPERLEAAEAVLVAWPVPASFGGDRACYLPSIDRIQLPDRASFHSPAAFCATWAHEQIHSTGHESRLKRDLGGAFGKPRYAREELVAEQGGGAAGRSAGDRQRDRKSCRLSGPLVELLKESPKVLFQVLSEARQAADLICPEPALPGPAELVGS